MSKNDTEDEPDNHGEKMKMSSEQTIPGSIRTKVFENS